MSDKPKVTAHYIKAPQFSEHPLHGIYGGVTPTGNFVMAAWSERMPIPSEIDLIMEPVEGQPGMFAGVEGERRGKEGIVRTVHSTFHFDLEMAISLRKWLDEKIKAVGGES